MEQEAYVANYDRERRLFMRQFKNGYDSHAKRLNNMAKTLSYVLNQWMANGDLELYRYSDRHDPGDSKLNLSKAEASFKPIAPIIHELIHPALDIPPDPQGELDAIPAQFGFMSMWQHLIECDAGLDFNSETLLGELVVTARSRFEKYKSEEIAQYYADPVAGPQTLQWDEMRARQYMGYGMVVAVSLHGAAKDYAESHGLPHTGEMLHQLLLQHEPLPNNYLINLNFNAMYIPSELRKQIDVMAESDKLFSESAKTIVDKCKFFADKMQRNSQHRG